MSYTQTIVTTDLFPDREAVDCYMWVKAKSGRFDSVLSDVYQNHHTIVKSLYLNIWGLWQTQQNGMYAYIFINCVVRWSENSVRFVKSYGNWLLDGQRWTVWDMAGIGEIWYRWVGYVVEQCFNSFYQVKLCSLLVMELNITCNSLVGQPCIKIVAISTEN